MAPIRRYLRITKYSVLEVRIYLENPALSQTWLLNPRDPVLPRIIEAVRPLVLPKLREEKEREREYLAAKKKGKKLKAVKDVVVQDDFEVTIFLLETDTRHSLLHRQKIFRDKVQTKITSNSTKLLGAGTADEPVDVDAGDVPHDEDSPVPVRREEDEDVRLEDIPMIDQPDEGADSKVRGEKRPRRPRRGDSADDAINLPSDEGDDTNQSDYENPDDASDSGSSVLPARPSKRHRAQPPPGDDDTGDSEAKKKLHMHITYEGFAIYGRVLCLVVKRRDGAGGFAGRGIAGAGIASASTGGAGAGRQQTGAAAKAAGQATMENWIASTQVQQVVEGEEGEIEE